MIEIRNILCPVDFSDFSKRAIDHAVAVAHHYESTVTLLHVYPGVATIAYADGVPLLDQALLTDEVRERLSSELLAFADCDEASGVPIRTIVRQGDAVREILSEAEASHVDLIAVGTHGRSGFERLVLGSVTEKLLRKASCPVLTVPRSHAETVPASPEVFKRILCPIDFSQCSMAALQYAMSMAQENDAALVVLFVVSSDVAPLPGQSPTDALDRTISVADFFIKRETHMQQLLQDAVPEAVRTYCSVDTIMSHGKPSSEILRLAAERQTDLIVMGVRGRGAADLTVFGSTTQHVVRDATCPVLTIRQGD